MRLLDRSAEGLGIRVQYPPNPQCELSRSEHKVISARVTPSPLHLRSFKDLYWRILTGLLIGGSFDYVPGCLYTATRNNIQRLMGETR